MINKMERQDLNSTSEFRLLATVLTVRRYSIIWENVSRFHSKAESDFNRDRDYNPENV